MGFGYQKWISHIKSRRPFSRRKVPIHTDASKNSVRSEFTPHRSEGFSGTRLYRILTSWFLVIPLFVVVAFSIYAYINKSDALLLYDRGYLDYTDQEVNSILLRSIKSHHQRGNYEYAKQELNTLLDRTNYHKEAHFIQLDIALNESKISPLHYNHAQQLMTEYRQKFPFDKSIDTLVRKHSQQLQ